MTPEAVHYGTAAALTQQRAVTLDAAFAANPIASRASHRSRPKLPNRCLDQSTEKGLNADQNCTDLLTNLMTPGVAMPLTRSERTGQSLALELFATA